MPKIINYYEVLIPDDMSPGKRDVIASFVKEDDAERASKGPHFYNRDAEVAKRQLILFENLEEYQSTTGKKVLSEQERLERILATLDDDDRRFIKNLIG